jgi:hypothetical protein
LVALNIPILIVALAKIDNVRASALWARLIGDWFNDMVFSDFCLDF